MQGQLGVGVWEGHLHEAPKVEGKRRNKGEERASRCSRPVDREEVPLGLE
jgi:hypothetical protein